ncbi:MAG: aromatic amino acid transport family protein [Patescibacteria group bacterium]
MQNNFFKNYVYPVSVFSGGMIGVGFLSLPYIAMRVGIWLMLLYFLVLTALILTINFIFCEISLKTPDFKRFPGFVGHYLGKWPQIFTMLLMILGSFGVLLVYLLIASQFLTSVFQPMFSGSSFLYALIYFCLVSVIIYFDIKLISKVEFWIIILLFLSLFLVFIEGFSQIKLSNIFAQNILGFDNFFLPYGPLLFALWGIGLIPEIEEMLGKGKIHLKKIVIISTILISVFYFLFVLLVLSITGSQTDQLALTGLKKFLGNGFASFSLLFGALATFTAFIAQGIVFKKVLMYDLKIKHWQAFVITCFTPLMLFLLGFKSFVPLISLIGGVILGINGILILLIYKKIGGKNIIIYPLSLVFLFGVIYEIIYFVN